MIWVKLSHYYLLLFVNPSHFNTKKILWIKLSRIFVANVKSEFKDKENALG
jgi:hypothetical protein